MSPAHNMSPKPWTEWENNTNKYWWKDKGLRLCVANVAILFLGCFSNGYDGVLINGLQVLPSWQTRFAPSSATLGLIVTSYYFPGVIMPYVFQSLCDRFGRRPVVALGSLIGIFGSLLGGLGNSLGTFIAARVLVGTAFFCNLVAIPSLVAETAHPRFRATATASFSNVYFLGTAVAGWVNFGVTYFDSDWAWRIPFILQCLGCVPIVIWACTPWMVESPRWLVSRGREEDAHRLLAKLHANGDMDDELVVMELCEIKEMVTFENGLPTGVEPYLAFFQTKGNRLRIFLCVFLSFSMAMAGNNILGSYLGQVLVMCGVTGALTLQGIVCGLTMWLLLVSMVTCLYIERFGRRRLYMVTITIMTVSMGVQIAFMAVTAEHPNVGKGAIATIFIFMTAYSVGPNPIWLLYLTEMLPFELRTAGIAVATFTFAIWTIFGNYIVPIAFAHIGYKYYYVPLAVNIVSLVIFFLYVKETKGRTLEEMAQVFDGPTVHRSVADKEGGYAQNAARSVEKLEVEHKE
ncbi:uncharacterized protein EHS24_004618 [Apiotrichum porosum]|uniref:Major facilitator superfamily (MFS) profile domain-containing protein n=1 Tax=Apiotrichum porosum TaxID=105984 RepID=A0A427Y5J9_9TREE|nr:uncharacterized protein EHS24_004618 [Apiotrichum porosum]RSH86369.1 hypothetical protein EHS24_004618 [Apiotrichum porosum]